MVSGGTCAPSGNAKNIKMLMKVRNENKIEQSLSVPMLLVKPRIRILSILIVTGSCEFLVFPGFFGFRGQEIAASTRLLSWYTKSSSKILVGVSGCASKPALYLFAPFEPR